jgi:hypothetical protein
MKVRATSPNTIAAMPTWTWKVTQQASGSLVTIKTSPLDDAASLVEFPLENPDRYEIIATVVEDPRCSGHAYAQGVPPGLPAYVFRVTAADFPVQERRVQIAAATSAPMSLVLDGGQSFTIRPRSPGQSSLLAAYVRITSPATAFTLEGDTTHGAVLARLLPQLTYDLLVVPADPTVAPELLTALPGDWSQGIDLDQGIHLTGRALGPDGGPLVGARLVLRRDQRPSTVGVSDATGNLELWTRSGGLSVTAVPPSASGLPQANVDVTTASAGIVLPANSSSPTITVRWNALTQAPLALTVVGPDGVTPAEGVKVRVSSRGWAAVASITATVNGSTVGSPDAFGSILNEAITDAAGNAAFPGCRSEPTT